MDHNQNPRPYLPKFITSKTFRDLSLATEQNRRPSALAAVQHIDPILKFAKWYGMHQPNRKILSNNCTVFTIKNNR